MMNGLQLLSRRTHNLFVVLLISVICSCVSLSLELITIVSLQMVFSLIGFLINAVFMGLEIFLVVLFYKASQVSKKMFLEKLEEGYNKYVSVLNPLNSFLLIWFILKIVVLVFVAIFMGINFLMV